MMLLRVEERVEDVLAGGYGEWIRDGGRSERRRQRRRTLARQGKTLVAQCLTVAAVRSMACIMEDLQRYTLPGLRHADDERG